MNSFFKKTLLCGSSLALALSLTVGSAVTGSTQSTAKKPALSSFTTIMKYVKKTFYVNPKFDTPKAAGKTTYDFNGDGKKESISFAYKFNDQDMGNLTLTVGSSTLKLKPMYFDGIYFVDLDKSDKSIEIAVQTSAEDDDVYTDFYRYNGKLEKLGELYGEMHDDIKSAPVAEYNSGILADGKGNFIPRFGAIQFVSPQILREYCTLKGSKITDINPDLSAALNKTYTLAGNSTPFFEQMGAMSKNFMPHCQDSDHIKLQKDGKITIKSISPSFGNLYCMFVQLQDKRTGVLYYYLHP